MARTGIRALFLMLPLSAAVPAAAQDPAVKAEAVGLAAAANGFGFELFQAVRKEGKNNFLSPVSIAIALHMAANGAVGKTREEMLRVLQFPNASAADVSAAAQTLLKRLNRKGDGLQMRTANSLWGGAGRMQWAPEFVALSRKHFDAPVRTLDFDDAEKAVKVINQWVSDATEAKIPNLIDRIEADVVAYLINAIYFKGDWRIPFDEKRTAKGAEFHRADGGRNKADLMYVQNRFGYRQGDGFTAAALPLGGKDSGVSMVVVLPDKGHGIGNVLPKVNAALLKEVAGQYPTEGTIRLPRFTVRWKKELSGPLQELGMQQAFDPKAADFTAMGTSPLGRLFIGRVLHEAVIEVNEKGAEAAAATAVEMRATSAGPLPWELCCDRPFVFAVYDAKADSVLFLGTFEDPGER